MNHTKHRQWAAGWGKVIVPAVLGVAHPAAGQGVSGTMTGAKINLAVDWPIVPALEVRKRVSPIVGDEGARVACSTDLETKTVDPVSAGNGGYEQRAAATAEVRRGS